MNKICPHGARNTHTSTGTLESVAAFLRAAQLMAVHVCVESLEFVHGRNKNEDTAFGEQGT